MMLYNEFVNWVDNNTGEKEKRLIKARFSANELYDIYMHIRSIAMDMSMGFSSRGIAILEASSLNIDYDNYEEEYCILFKILCGIVREELKDNSGVSSIYYIEDEYHDMYVYSICKETILSLSEYWIKSNIKRRLSTCCVTYRECYDIIRVMYALCSNVSCKDFGFNKHDTYIYKAFGVIAGLIKSSDKKVLKQVERIYKCGLINAYGDLMKEFACITSKLTLESGCFIHIKDYNNIDDFLDYVYIKMNESLIEKIECIEL